MTVSMAILAGVLKEPKLGRILVILPTIVFIFLYYWFATANEIRSLGAYKRYLERQLAILIGKDYFFWETRISPLRNRDVPRAYLHVVYGIIVVCLVVVSGYISWQDLGRRAGITLTFWHILLILGLIHSFKVRDKISDQVYLLCESSPTKKDEEEN